MASGSYQAFIFQAAELAFIIDWSVVLLNAIFFIPLKDGHSNVSLSFAKCKCYQQAAFLALLEGQFFLEMGLRRTIRVALQKIGPWILRVFNRLDGYGLSLVSRNGRRIVCPLLFSCLVFRTFLLHGH